MGWEINDHGMKVLFSRDITSIVRTCVLPNVMEFLTLYRLGLPDLNHIIAHPGGAKVLDAYRETLRLSNGKLDVARSILRRYGNMSSPTVLFVLDEFLRSGSIRPGEHGLITALGPGFSSEMLLVRG
jgi:alkylresorcinol/alkylpyrone synthase